MKKLGFISSAAFCVMVMSGIAQAQLFKQDFSSSTTISDYVSATPNNGQFNAIGTSGAGTVVSINSGALQYARTANVGSFSRTTDFTPTPTSLIYKITIGVSGNTVAQTTAAVIQLGSGFGTANSAEANASTYARFGINFTTTDGTFSIRDISSSTNSGDFSGTQTLIWALNNSGGTLIYVAPDGTQESVANDAADIWIGTTRAFNDVAALTAAQTMTDLKFAFTAGSATIRLDNIQIDPLAGLFSRSAQTGNWNSSSTWESSTDNSIFYPAINVPTSDANSITIRSPHNVTVSSAVTVDQLTVDSGGEVSVSSGVTFTIADGVGTDLIVNGTANVIGAGVINGTGSFALLSGASLIIGDPNGITSGITVSGNIQVTGGRTFDTGANYTYNGGSAQNTGSGLPSTVNDLEINNGAGVSLSSSVAVNGTLVLTSGTLTVGANTLTLRNPIGGTATNLSADGTSSITIAGSASGINIPSSISTLNNLTLNNASGTTLQGNLTVAGTLGLTSGDITTGSFTLFMGTGSISSGNGDVVGNVNRGDLNGGTPRSFGNPNVQITITAGTVTGMTVNLIKASPSDFGNSARRTYDLKEVVGTLVTATVRLHYLDSELNGNSEVTLDLWRKDGNNWVSQGATTRDSADNWVEKTLITSFSPWTISGPSGPTYVAMVGYSANQGLDGRVLLMWETGQEINNLGFNIYREQDGRRTRINKSLIVGSGLMTKPGTVMSAGRSYLWRSSAVVGDGSAYWIEEIDLNGSSVWYGPIVSRPSPDGMLTMSPREQAVADQTVTLEDLATESAQAGVTVPAQTPAGHVNVSVAKMSLQLGLASHDAVKITVKQEGWYRIGKSELVAAGLNPKADPRSLQLYADGVEAPLTITPDPLKFDSTSAIEFYAVGLDTPSTDHRVYWLISAKTEGIRIPTVSGGGGLPSANCFLSTVKRRDRLIYLSGLHNGDAENFFGTPVGSAPVDQAITLQHIDATASGQATLEVGMQGFSMTPHNVIVSLNGNPLGAMHYEGAAAGVMQFTVPNNVLSEGQNVVTLAGQQGVVDVSLVDHIRVSYWRTYSSDDNSLRFTAQGNQQVTISGFTTGDVRVLDVTNPNEPSMIAAAVDHQNSTYAVTVGVPWTGDRTLVAFGGDQARNPLRLEANRASTWRSAANQADLVIIAHNSLKESFTQLAALRQAQGLKVATVDVDDIYDEFNFGNKSPQAIKDFLSYAKDNWKKSPRYVLLAGSASYDPKNYNGFGSYDLVPTKLIDTIITETASDDWFADFDLDGIPELAIGRLPAHTTQEATATVAKLISYESGSPQNSALLVADDNLGFDFEAANNELAPLFPAGISVQQINRGQIGTSIAKQQLLDGIARGQKVVNYVGHGSPSGWRDRLLTTADAVALGNEGRYPLFLLMTCLNGEFQHPQLNTLATGLMNAPQGGAIAVWASSGLTEPAPQAMMNQRFFNLLFQLDRQNRGPRLGDATMRAKLVTSDPDVRRTWILFGDPSMRLK